MPNKSPKRQQQSFEYDVCLSFAGEDREYVARVHEELQLRGLRVFYDEAEQAKLWGKDLYSHLDDVYRNSAQYCIVFISKHYAKKLWTNHERRSAQARAFAENTEYLLPVRFDTTKISGLPQTVGYLDARKVHPAELAALAAVKLGERRREFFLPPNPNLLFERLKARGERRKNEIGEQARSFIRTWKRMSDSERRLVAAILVHGCPEELPENVHISSDLLRRETGIPLSRIVRELRGLSSLGFSAAARRATGSHANTDEEPMIVLSYENRWVEYPASLNATPVIFAMVAVGAAHYCETCSVSAVMRADYSHLSAVTQIPESHRHSQSS